MPFVFFMDVNILVLTVHAKWIIIVFLHSAHFFSQQGVDFCVNLCRCHCIHKLHFCDINHAGGFIFEGNMINISNL